MHRYMNQVVHNVVTKYFLPLNSTNNTDDSYFSSHDKHSHKPFIVNAKQLLTCYLNHDLSHDATT